MQVDDTLADEGGAVQLNLLVCLVINACQLLARIFFLKKLCLRLVVRASDRRSGLEALGKVLAPRLLRCDVRACAAHVGCADVRERLVYQRLAQQLRLKTLRRVHARPR